jgi:RNA polymerase sigma-70 factor (ECF subfamily)
MPYALRFTLHVSGFIISVVAGPEKTTEEIVRELKQGQDWEENFQVLFERYYDQLYRFFRRKGMLPEDCRDLTQETFFSVYKGFSELREESQFENWLYRIAMNVYINEIERRQAKKRAASHVPLEEEWVRSQDLRLDASQTVSPQANPMEAMLEKERKEKLHEALQELPPQMRHCVQLRVVKDIPTQEIAAIMGISVNTVKAHLHQARKVLKEKLSSYFGEVEI